MKFIPVKEHLEENKLFLENPDCQDILFLTVDFYKKIGYNCPWVCYYVQLDGNFIGCAGYKGKPKNGRVEIAYAVFEPYCHRGYGNRIAAALIDLAIKTDPSAIITAKTLPEENYSTQILRRNNFKLLGEFV